VKVSVSLPQDDVEFLDQYASDHGIDSRSAVLQRAVRLLRTTGLTAAYAEAWTDWEHHGDAALWESTDADGLA
jgi:antitoxin MazE9